MKTPLHIGMMVGLIMLFGAAQTRAQLGLWTRPASGTVNNLAGITFGGNNMFVAVGGKGTILTSTDGYTWTPRISGTTADLMGVCYGSDLCTKTFVAVGGKGTILTSPNGIDWTQRNLGRNDYLESVAPHNAYDPSPYHYNVDEGTGTAFVAVGWDYVANNSAIVTSINGINWTIVNAAGGQGSPNDLHCIAYSRTGATDGAFYYVAVGNQETTLIDEFGTWCVAALTGNNSFYGLAGDDQTYLVAVGANGLAMRSFVDFTEYGDTFVSGMQSGTTANLYSVTFGNGTWMAVGAGGVVQINTNLNLQASPTWVGSNSGVTRNLRGVVYGNGLFVAVGDGGTIITAPAVGTTTIAAQASPVNGGTVTGGGTYAQSRQVSLTAVNNLGWEFSGWSDGVASATRNFTVLTNASYTANFTSNGNVSLSVMLQAGTGGLAGLWSLGATYAPATWSQINGNMGGGWVLRALNQNRVLLQAGTGGMIGIWDLNTNHTPSCWWPVSGPLPGWIARDLDGSNMLLQQGDGGMIGLWTLNTNCTPATWTVLSGAIPGWIARGLRTGIVQSSSVYTNGVRQPHFVIAPQRVTRVLLQSSSGNYIGYWTLDSSNRVTAWTQINATVPSGWILRSLTPNYILLQAGDGGMAGIWDLDANGQPIAWHVLSGAMPGWVMRGIDQ